MKRILIVLCLSLCVVLIKAQDTTLLQRLNYLYEDFHADYTAGNLRTMQPKWNKMSRATNLYFTLMAAVGEGDATLAGDALSALNTMFGTAYSLPSFDFDETTSPFFNGDSLKLGDMSSYVTAVLSPTEVSGRISDSLSGLSTQWRGDIGDSLAVERVARSQEIQALPGIDSSWSKIYVSDTIEIGTEGVSFVYLPSTNTLKLWYPIGSGTTTGDLFGWVNYESYFYAGVGSAGLSTITPTATTPNVHSNVSDINTGQTWISEDKGGLTAGGLAIAYYQEIASKELFEVVDSFVVNGRTNMIDSAYLDYLQGGEDFWLYVESNSGAIKGDTLQAVGFGLRDELIPILEYLNNRTDGELAWRYSDPDGKIRTEHNTKGTPSQVIQKLFWQTEHLLRYTADQEVRLQDMEKRINALMLIIIGMTVVFGLLITVVRK